MTCPNCNSTNHEEGAIFCHICGTQLRDSRVLQIGKDEYYQLCQSKTRLEVLLQNGYAPNGRQLVNDNEYNVLKNSKARLDGILSQGYAPNGKVIIDNTEYNSLKNRHHGEVKLGRQWRMPSFDQFMELIRNCEFEFTTLNGVLGGKFTSKINGNSIFFPTTGMYKDHQIQFRDNAVYWSGTHEPVGYDEYLAYSFGFISGWVSTGTHERNIGLPVRPIMMGNSSKIQASGEKQ